MRVFAQIVGATLLFVALFIGWFIIASDYGEAVTCGTYSLVQQDERSILTLRPDHTFAQQVNAPGQVRNAVGTWHRVGEGGVAFSKEFLALPGQELAPDGTSWADIEKKFGILVRLRLREYQVVWYSKTNPSTTNTVEGTYHRNEAGMQTTLVMKADHTFKETVSGSAKSTESNGTWREDHGDIIFSKEFLKCSGYSLNDNESAIAMDPRGSNFLQIEIAAGSKSGVPTFHKKQFPWQ